MMVPTDWQSVPSQVSFSEMHSLAIRDCKNRATTWRPQRKLESSSFNWFVTSYSPDAVMTRISGQEKMRTSGTVFPIPLVTNKGTRALG